MKKIYLLLFLLPFIEMNAQVPSCGYDHTFIASGKKGIWPDSAINFVSGTVGVPYSQNVTIVIPYDTVTSLGTYHYSHVNLKTNITSPANYGLPPGLSLAGTPSTFIFPGNDSSCIIIYGTPTTPGLYHLTFKLDVYFTEFGNSFPYTTQTLTYYKININPAVGIATNSSYGFQVMQNMPNPVHDNTSIKFTSGVEGKAKFAIYNLAGQKIAEKEVTAQRGENSFDFDSTPLESGMYLYSLEMNHQKQCRRMVITH
ncbi:MAG TPA: T9SS type A sorting domain-containing protein [Bacteroidia bacterium]|jgi:hypothetical protein|nr:T9SS type A sorting domain-containing protein [Bacteroidia bacterium]